MGANERLLANLLQVLEEEGAAVLAVVFVHGALEEHGFGLERGEQRVRRLQQLRVQLRDRLRLGSRHELG